MSSQNSVNSRRSAVTPAGPPTWREVRSPLAPRTVTEGASSSASTWPCEPSTRRLDETGAGPQIGRDGGGPDTGGRTRHGGGRHHPVAQAEREDGRVLHAVRTVRTGEERRVRGGAAEGDDLLHLQAGEVADRQGRVPAEVHQFATAGQGGIADEFGAFDGGSVQSAGREPLRVDRQGQTDRAGVHDAPCAHELRRVEAVYGGEEPRGAVRGLPQALSTAGVGRRGFVDQHVAARFERAHRQVDVARGLAAHQGDVAGGEALVEVEQRDAGRAREGGVVLGEGAVGGVGAADDLDAGQGPQQRYVVTGVPDPGHDEDTHLSRPP